MTNWQSRVTSHLRQRGLELPDGVVEELAAHLEDAWEAEYGPAADPAGIDAFVARGLQRAHLTELTHTRPARPALPRYPSPAAPRSCAAWRANCVTHCVCCGARRSSAWRSSS